MLVFAGISLACSSLADSAAPAVQLNEGTSQALAVTQAAVLTQIAQPTTTGDPGQIAAPGQTLFREEFDQELVEWEQLLVGENSNSELVVENGSMLFTINDNYLYAYWFYHAESYRDVEVVTRVSNHGSAENYMTLICRQSDQGWYEFNVSSDADYEIYFYDAGNGDYLEIESGTSLDIVEGDATNEIRLVCKGNQLSLYANEIHITSVTDTILQEGRIGFSAGSREDLPVIVAFEWLEVRIPSPLSP